MASQNHLIVLSSIRGAVHLVANHFFSTFYDGGKFSMPIGGNFYMPADTQENERIRSQCPSDVYIESLRRLIRERLNFIMI
jgi:hypothetical protein